MPTSLDPSRLREEAVRLGFERVAFATAETSPHEAHLKRWLAQGRHGDMAWMERTAQVRANPGALLPGARSVVSLLTPYYTTPGDRGQPWVGRVSRYAWGRDYHNVLGRRLRKLARFVRESVPGAVAVPAVDSKPILEKDWAERAGLGWIGKHTNLITEDAGSWFFLSELITNVEFPPAEAPGKERCGSCTACLDACPTGAIVGPWEVDARRCISYLTIELKTAIPRELRPLMGEWIFGCDICQDVCPWNRFAVSVTEPAFQQDQGRFAGDLESLLTLSEDVFLARYEGSPVRRAGRNAFVRNVCVALGNRGDPKSLPALTRALRDESALVRSHAAWAIGEIGGGGARACLRECRAAESDPDVLAEIEAALATD